MFRKKDDNFFRLGLTLLTVIVISALFYVVITNIGVVYNEIKSFLGILSSVIFGMVFAYLMNPVMKLVERATERIFRNSNITERGLKKLKRSLGVVISLLVFLAIIYGLFAMVVPELIESLSETFSTENLQNFYETATTWLNNTAKGTPIEDWVLEHDPIRAIFDWVTKELDLIATLSTAFTEVYGVLKVVFNMLIGIVVAVYMLISKERFQAQSKKLVAAMFKPQRANRILEIARLTNRCFGGFIVGKLIDSLIIGVISYIGMIILGLPYALVSSVFVGLTNIIPFFGPLIGIVIGGVLILLQSPLDCLYFVIFELALQQVDGNIIGPRILGEKLGISDFWILVSITLFGGLFGFPGMILGVPVFTVIYALISQSISNSLERKNLPVKTDCYYSIFTVEDLEAYNQEFQESTVFNSADTFETEYDPDDEIEYDESEES